MRDNSWMVTRARTIQPKKTAVTLNQRGPRDSKIPQAYPNAYVEPITQSWGDGAATSETQIILYQEGEALTPVGGNTITDSFGVDWLIVKIKTRLNYRPNWGIHTCTCTRAG
jgi:hypothetical protein